MEDDDSKLYGETNKRHVIGINTVSLLDEDGLIDTQDSIVFGKLMYQEIIRSLDTDRERFIAIAIDNGFKNIEIASMLGLHPATTSNLAKKIRVKLKSYL
jgi:DNA-binding NarL/FixJ family response regulator